MGENSGRMKGEGRKETAETDNTMRCPFDLPVDMFPHTSHCEMVMLFSRASAAPAPAAAAAAEAAPAGGEGGSGGGGGDSAALATPIGQVGAEPPSWGGRQTHHEGLLRGTWGARFLKPCSAFCTNPVGGARHGRHAHWPGLGDHHGNRGSHQRRARNVSWRGGCGSSLQSRSGSHIPCCCFFVSRVHHRPQRQRARRRARPQGAAPVGQPQGPPSGADPGRCLRQERHRDRAPPAGQQGFPPRRGRPDRRAAGASDTGERGLDRGVGLASVCLASPATIVPHQNSNSATAPHTISRGAGM